MTSQQYTRILLVQRLEELQQLNSRTLETFHRNAIEFEINQVNEALKELDTEESVNK